MSGVHVGAGDRLESAPIDRAPARGRSRRLIRAVVRSGAAGAVVGGLLLSACGDDGDSNAGSGADVGSVEDFCATMDRLNVELGRSEGFAPRSDDDDPEAALQAVSGIDPPAEIADDWQTVVDMTQDWAEALRDGEDFELEDEAPREAAERVITYVDVQCSVDLRS